MWCCILEYQNIIWHGTYHVIVYYNPMVSTMWLYMYWLKSQVEESIWEGKKMSIAKHGVVFQWWIKLYVCLVEPRCRVVHRDSKYKHQIHVLPYQNIAYSLTTCKRNINKLNYLLKFIALFLRHLLQTITHRTYST